MLKKSGETLINRPFSIIGVQQIAVGSDNKSALKHLWVDLLGLDFLGTYKSEAENVDEDICSIGQSDMAIEVDLMQPLDKSRSPRVDKPALNHIGLWVDDLEVAVAWLSSKGVNFTPGGIREGASGYRVCFVHPKSSQTHPFGGEGVLIELVQAPKSVIESFNNSSQK